MAFLGDIGRFFLGGASTSQVAPLAGAAIGSFVGGPSGAQIGASIGSGIGQVIEGTANQPEQQSSIPTPPNIRGFGGGIGGGVAQENAMSGSTNQAFLGSLAPVIAGARSIATQAGRFLGSPTGSAIGIGSGLGSFAMSGSGDSRMKPVLTQSRRNKAKVRQLVNFMGIEGTAQFLSQSIGQNVSANNVVALLLRTFRNDGAFITKAQVRNLRRTTNRFKSLEKQVKEAVSIGTTRRPAVRRTVNRSTSIKI